MNEKVTELQILCVGILLILIVMALGIKHEIVSAKQEIIQAIHGEASR